MVPLSWWFGWLVFNGTVSTNRLYRAVGVWNILCRAGAQDMYTIKQWNNLLNRSYNCIAPYESDDDGWWWWWQWSLMDEWLCFIIVIIVNVFGIIEIKLILCRYQPPVLAISSLYWKAWTVLLILAAFNPASFGMLFQLPFVHFKYVSNRFIVRRFVV